MSWIEKYRVSQLISRQPPKKLTRLRSKVLTGMQHAAPSLTTAAGDWRRLPRTVL